MRLHPHRTLASLIVALTVACATAGSGPARSSSGGNRAIITETDLANTGTESAYDAIQRLRPEFLRTRPSESALATGTATAPPLSIVVNGQHVGELEDLRRIPAASLAEIHYYNVEEAKRKFGMQYQGGVIELTYRTR